MTPFHKKLFFRGTLETYVEVKFHISILFFFLGIKGIFETKFQEHLYKLNLIILGMKEKTIQRKIYRTKQFQTSATSFVSYAFSLASSFFPEKYSIALFAASAAESFNSPSLLTVVSFPSFAFSAV